MELCVVVEALFSLQHVVAITGDPLLADRLERIAFNALPATFSADMWAHQYNQQANQVLCTLEKRQWVSNGPESNLFGVEPNFGCCTANMHQGWPKLAQSLWMATRGGGLAATVFAPSEVRTVVRGAGLQPGQATTPIRIVETTDYPFRGEVTFALHPDRPVRFRFRFAFLHGPRAPPHRATAVHRSKCRRVDSLGHRRDVETRRPRRAAAADGAPRHHVVSRVGTCRARPARLLAPDGEWKPIATGMKRPAPPPAKDWEVRPRSPWNYGLVVGKPGAPQADSALKVTEKPVGEYPFSPLGAPVEIAAGARRVPEWRLVDGSAGPLPQSPVTSSAPDETITLVPYGSAKLRVTVFSRIRP